MPPFQNEGAHPLKRMIVACSIVLSLGVIGVGGVMAWGWWAMRPVSQVPQFKTVYIAPGTSTRTIGQQLSQQGIIRHATLFWVYAKLMRKERFIWSGYYNMSPHFDFMSVFRVLTEATPYSRLVRITIKEGQSLQQIARLLEEKKLTQADRFTAYVTYQAKWDLLEHHPWLAMVPTTNLEGVLFPDTYLFPPMASDPMMTRTMIKRFESTIITYWQQVSPNTQLDFYSALVMASMIEKEAGNQAEMPTIASVFHNRLAINMPLASDPTVLYALGLDWKKIVLYKDLKVASPYNTYRHVGLPPTPISSPGLAAFKAAVWPDVTRYLFFVAHPNGGAHTFTRTYREHLAAQKR